MKLIQIPLKIKKLLIQIQDSLPKKNKAFLECLD